MEIDFSLAVSLMPNDTVTNHQFFFLLYVCMYDFIYSGRLH